jgi:hypothetical protein
MAIGCNFRLTIVRHGENRNLGNGTIAALDTTGTLVHGGQISVHVTRVTTTTRNLFTGSGDLTKSVTVGRQIGKNDEDVLLELVGVVLGGCKSKTRGDNTFDAAIAVSGYFQMRSCFDNLRRVVCQVGEHGDTLHRSVLLEVLGEETGSFQVHTHGTENDGEVVIVHIVHTLALVLDETSLATDLCGNLVVRKTRSREDRDLLTTSDGVHGVNGADTSGDHLLGVDTRVGVDRRTVDVEVVLSKNLGALVNGATRTVENTTQHVLAHSELQVVAGELDFGLVSR